MVSAMIVGCGNENPWTANPSTAIDVFLVSAPDSTSEVPSGATINFVWAANGNSDITYRWFLQPMESSYRASSGLTSIVYVVATDTIDVDYTFHLRATDAAGNTDSILTTFTVLALVPAPADTLAPTITITKSPAEGAYVATGSNLAFAWMGDDGQGNDDELMYQYAFPTADDSSEWVAATTATFEDVAAADPAGIFIRAKDAAGNTSDWDSVTFTIRDATILYLDDYQWLDGWGDVDREKERDQKQFYRNALDGYAFAEWDVAVQGFPDSSDLVDAGTPIYSTIIYAADSELGSTSGNAWTYLGDPGNGKGYSIRYYLEQGGNLLLGGALALLDMTQDYPPAVAEGDFEFDWLGIDSTTWCFDYWADFTWAVKDSATTLILPDSMKIDVAKNGNQVDYAMDTPGLRNEAVVTTEVIYVWGLNIDGGPTDAYGHPLAHLTKWDGTTRTALLDFDMYSMPLEGIRMTFQAILDEFGE